jgi:hypothetical protein
MVEILDSQRSSTQSLVLMGSIASLYGIIVYYGLPYALLTQNIALILGIFFFILMGMLFGVTLLT